jgi:hypothetical protein
MLWPVGDKYLIIVILTPSRYSKKFRIKELPKIQNPKTLNPKTLNPRFLKIFRFEEIIEAGYFKNFSFQES